MLCGKKSHNDNIKYDTIVTSKGAAFSIYLHILFFTFILSASRNVCGESITDKASTEAPRLLSHLYIWGVMINIVSQLNIFLYV